MGNTLRVNVSGREGKFNYRSLNLYHGLRTICLIYSVAVNTREQSNGGDDFEIIFFHFLGFCFEGIVQ